MKIGAKIAHFGTPGMMMSRIDDDDDEEDQQPDRADVGALQQVAHLHGRHLGMLLKLK